MFCDNSLSASQLKLTSCLLFFACLFSCKQNNNQIQKTSTPASGPGSIAAKNYADDTYVTKVYVSLVTELHINRIAVRRSKDPMVRQLATDLLKSYETLEKRVAAVASARHVALDPRFRFDQENHIKFLSEEPSGTFNREYLDILVREHKKFTEDFQLTGTNSYDPDISALSAEVLKVITANYTRILTVQAKIATGS